MKTALNCRSGTPRRVPQRAVSTVVFSHGQAGGGAQWVVHRGERCLRRARCPRRSTWMLATPMSRIGWWVTVRSTFSGSMAWAVMSTWMRATQILRGGLGSFSRFILFDRRGTGASDGLARNAMPAWEEWADDLGAVLDAAGSETTAIWATVDSGPIAMMFAASHPERVSALILDNTSARFLKADDYPIGMSQARVDAVVEIVGSLWGSEEFLAVQNPGLADDAKRARRVARKHRAAATRATQPLNFGTSLRTSTSARFCTSSKLRRWCCTRPRMRSSASTTAATSPVTSQRRGSLNCRDWARPR